MVRSDLGGAFLSVISHARAANVAKMAALVGDATWFVGVGEAAAYRAAGAKEAVESGPLCRSRNAAIDAACAVGAPCIELSDDLTRVQMAVQGPKKVEARDATFGGVVARVLQAMAIADARLAGAAPTNNPFYANVEKPINLGAFIVGDFIIVGADCQLRFDERMTLKEDYDFTLQHLATYGRVARCDDVLMTFLHRKNAGGAVEVRTTAEEQKNIAFLKARWPQFVRDNPKRPDEILLKLPRVARV